MRTIRIKHPGSYDVLELVERPTPSPGPDDLLVRVRAAGVNRADCMQRMGTYPIPAGTDWGDVPGLEVAGEVAAVGNAVIEFKVGDRVFGLVPQGGYAEFALVDCGLALPIPHQFSFVEAAGIIESFATANETVFEIGELKIGETIFIHAAASGVGSTAVQMAKAAGATVIVSAGSQAKLQRLFELGANLTINYKEQDFVREVKEVTGDGVDLVLDFIGADYLARNLAVLRRTGRLILVGQLGSPTCVFDPSIMIGKRLTMRGFTLRPQSLADRRKIVQRVGQRWLPLLQNGQIRPILHSTFPLDAAAAAHRLMETNTTFGKIILEVS